MNIQVSCRLFSAIIVSFIAFPVITSGQISISSTTPVTESFTIGASATASLPANWKMSAAGTTAAGTYAAGTNVTAVNVQASSGTPVTGGRYNWGTSATERAIGFMTSGGYSSPNSIMAFYRNTSGVQINNLTISFDIERYRENTATFGLTFFTSTDGNTWTARTTGDIATSVFSNVSSVYDFTAATFVTRTVTLTGINIANNGDFYVKWLFTNTGGSNSQGMGLDNVSLTATLASSTATLADITQPAGSVQQGGTNVVLSGFTLGSSVSANFTAVTLSAAGTATATDIANIRVFRDNDANGTINGADASVSGAGVTYSASMPLSITGETGITTARNYLVVADIAGAGVSTLARTTTVSVGSGAFTTSATINTGSATGSSRSISGAAPVLTAAAGATVDAPFNVTFTDDASWRAAGSTIVSVNGTQLTAGFSITSGQITFTPSASIPASLLQVSGSKSISISKTGYGNATVTQAVGVGAATQLVVTTEPTAPAANGSVLGTQPVVAIRDQYGNTTASTAQVTAAVSAGTWTLGGTVTVSAVSGIATFTNLTATSIAAVTGATIQVTSTGFTSDISSAFNIAAPNYTAFSTLGIAVTENFNTLGPSGTAALPMGYVTTTGTAFTGGTTATTLAYGSSGTGAVASNSSGGVINWATGATASSSERALGYITTGSFTGPLSLMAKFKNVSGATISSMLISFDYEKYRSGARAFNWTFFYSTDGSTWTAVTQGDQAYAADADNTVISATPLSVTKSISLTGLSVANGNDFYLRWNYAGVGGYSNGQGLAVDNLSVIPFSNTNTTGSNISGALTNLNITGGKTTLTANTDIANMANFAAGSSIDLGGFTLTLNGNINGNLLITGSNQSGLVISGSGTTGNIIPNQTSNSSRSLNTLTINRTGSTITLGDSLIVTGTLSLNNGTLATAGKLTLASSSAGTAGIAPITGTGIISGNIIAERYIASSGRRWRFVASCMSNATLEDWRKETYITGAGTGTTAGALNSNGFDATLSNASSLFSYNEPTAGNFNNGWLEVTNNTASLTNVALTPGKGYRMFIRGDRSDPGRLTGTVTTQNEVTLNLIGTVNAGNIVMPVSFTNTLDVSNDGWNLLGNPYPAAYDWNAFYDNGANFTNIDPIIYILDANTNSYKSYNATSTGTLTNGIIPSGASFWAKANAASPALTFTEAFKTSTAPMSLLKTGTVNNQLHLSMVMDSVNKDDYILAFIDGSSKDHDGFDVRKLSNATVNISSAGADGLYHTVDARPGLVLDDTVQLNVSGSNAAMKFHFNAVPDNGKYYFLQDAFNGSITPIDTAVEYSFTINNMLAATFGARFKIIISGNASLPVTYTGFVATKSERQVLLSWSTASESNNKQFDIERSNDDQVYKTIGSVKGNENSSVEHQYFFMDERPEMNGVNYYRLKQTDMDGNSSYSTIQAVSFEQYPAVVVTEAWPNPVRDVFNLKVGSMSKHTVEIYTVSGKIVSQSVLDSDTDHLLTINTRALTAGLYIVKIKDETGNSTSLKMLKD